MDSAQVTIHRRTSSAGYGACPVDADIARRLPAQSKSWALRMLARHSSKVGRAPQTRLSASS